MQQFMRPLPALHVGALDAALRAALVSNLIGLSTYGSGQPISIWLSDSATPTDVITMDSIIAAHDPIFLSADKTTIATNYPDTATITIAAPKLNATPVTLLVAGSPVAVQLTAGLGTITVQTATPSLISISVQAAANRTIDSLQIQGI